MELVEELNYRRHELDEAMKTLRKHGIERANAEFNYKKELRKRSLEMMAEGMGSTMINLTVKGEDSVAEARLLRDIALETKEANLEYINATKLQIRVLETMLKIEWGNTE